VYNGITLPLTDNSVWIIVKMGDNGGKAVKKGVK